MCGQRVPVYSPRISLDMMTVKIGAELFTVSANDTATFFKLTRPKTTVVNLIKIMSHTSPLEYCVKNFEIIKLEP